MKVFARVPVVPGPVAEIYRGDALFPMHEDVAATFYEADEGTLEGHHFDGKTYTLPAPPAVDPKETVMVEIRTLEAEITPRRMSEAVMGVDDGWLKERAGQIAVLREKLRA